MSIYESHCNLQRKSLHEFTFDLYFILIVKFFAGFYVHYSVLMYTLCLVNLLYILAVKSSVAERYGCTSARL